MDSGDPDGAGCPACGGRLIAWRSVRAAEPGWGLERIALLRCVTCATAVTTGAAAPEVHDSGAFRAGTPRLHGLALPLLRRFDAQRLALLRTLAQPPARVLDAGAGQGRFVAAARAAGYDAFGVESSPRGLDRAAALGVPVIHASIDAAEIPEASLDAITLWHVLEHLECPGAALARLARWLKPGAGLLLGVPNLASVQAWVGSERWYHLDVPRHRTHFTPRGIELLLRSSGFVPISVRHVLLEHNPFGMWQSAVNRITAHPSYLYNLLKRNAPLRSRDLAITLAALALVPAAAAAELVAGLARRGGTIAVLARRG